MRSLAPLSSGLVFAVAVGCSADDSGWVDSNSPSKT